MKKSALFFLLLLPAAALLFNGCAHTVMPQVTPLQFDSDSMELLGPVTGEATKTSYFWGMFEAPPAGDGFSTQAAIQDALDKVHGDALLNPTVDQDVKDYVGFYYVVTLRVSGLAVRFKNKHRPYTIATVEDTPLAPEPTPTPVPTAIPTPAPKKAKKSASHSASSGSSASTQTQSTN